MINDLIAKAAIDQRLAEIITPVIEDLGFELVRVRLMSGKETTLQVMADNADGGIDVDNLAKSQRRLARFWTWKIRFLICIRWKCRARALTAH